MSFQMTDRAQALQDDLLAFMDEHVYPAEAVYLEQMRESGDPVFHPPIVEELKVDCGPVTLAATIHSPGPGGPRTGDRLALWVATEDVIVLADEGASP